MEAKDEALMAFTQIAKGQGGSVARKSLRLSDKPSLPLPLSINARVKRWRILSMLNRRGEGRAQGFSYSPMTGSLPLYH